MMNDDFRTKILAHLHLELPISEVDDPFFKPALLNLND